MLEPNDNRRRYLKPNPVQCGSLRLTDWHDGKPRHLLIALCPVVAVSLGSSLELECI